ncbi:hypothetical protein PENTCL1PPCAC_4804, partial [Pristionchus entomophagus]
PANIQIYNFPHFAVGNGFNVRLRIVIDRSYFSLASIIDLEKNTASYCNSSIQEHFNEVVLPQWERVICRKALALDIRDPSSSSMLRLLNIIWESEYGWFPVAKRVVIGRLADMV